MPYCPVMMNNFEVVAHCMHHRHIAPMCVRGAKLLSVHLSASTHQQPSDLMIQDASGTIAQTLYPFKTTAKYVYICQPITMASVATD